jgi:hypothetical protein
LRQDVRVIVFVVRGDGLTCHPVVKVSGAVDGTAFLCSEVYGVQTVAGHKFFDGASRARRLVKGQKRGTKLAEESHVRG